MMNIQKMCTLRSSCRKLKGFCAHPEFVKCVMGRARRPGEGPETGGGRGEVRVSCSTVFEKITPPASWHLYRYKTVQLCLIGPNYCSMVATNLRFLQIVSVEFDHWRGRARGHQHRLRLKRTSISSISYAMPSEPYTFPEGGRYIVVNYLN